MPDGSAVFTALPHACRAVATLLWAPHVEPMQQTDEAYPVSFCRHPPRLECTCRRQWQQRVWQHKSRAARLTCGFGARSAVREAAAALLQALHAEHGLQVDEALADAGVRPTQLRELAARFGRGGGAGGRRDSATTSELEAASEARPVPCADATRAVSLREAISDLCAHCRIRPARSDTQHLQLARAGCHGCALSSALAACQAGSEATSQRSSPSRGGDAHAPGTRGGAAARRGGYMVRARRPRPRAHKALKCNACG